MLQNLTYIQSILSPFRVLTQCGSKKTSEQKLNRWNFGKNVPDPTQNRDLKSLKLLFGSALLPNKDHPHSKDLSVCFFLFIEKYNSFYFSRKSSGPKMGLLSLQAGEICQYQGILFLLIQGIFEILFLK